MRGVLGILLVALFGLLFEIGAIRSCRRMGRTGLAVAWFLGTLLITAIVVFNYHFNRIAVGGGPGWGPDMASLPLFLALAACACGGATLVLLRRLRKVGSVSRADVGASLGGFVAGAVLPIVVAFGRDIATLLSNSS